MRDQAMLYGATIREGYVSVLQGAGGGKFTARLESGETVSAEAVILATGVVENKPPVPHFADTVKRG
jgi:thioredoxin reductase (NADPH)